MQRISSRWVVKAPKIYNPDVPGYPFKINTTPEKVTGILKAGGSVSGIDGLSVIAPPNWTLPPISITLERIDPSTLSDRNDNSSATFTNYYRISTTVNIYSKVPIYIQLKLPRGFPTQKLSLFGYSRHDIIGEVDFGGEYFWEPNTNYHVEGDVVIIKLYGIHKESPYVFVALSPPSDPST